MRLLIGLVLILCLSSCQQRYWHIKRVKADKNKSVHKEKLSPEKETETRTIAPVESLPETQVPPDNEPKAKAVVPETNPQVIPDKSGPMEDLLLTKPFKDLLPDPADDDPDEVPLTFGEKVLIISIFFFLFAFFFYLALIPAFIALYLWLWFLVTPATIAILLGFSLILAILAFVGSFKLGKKWINKKLKRELKWDDLLGDFIFVTLIFFLTLALFALFLYLGINAVAVIMLNLPILLFLLAALYIIWWKK